MTSPFSDLISDADRKALRDAAGMSTAAAATAASASDWVDLEVSGFDVKADGPGTLEHKADAGFGGTQVLEADDKTGRVVALVSVTGVEDRVKDTIEPGAYAKTIANHEPIGVWSHDDKTWVARTEHAEELMPGDPFFADLKTMDGKPWPKEAGAVKVEALFNLETPHGAAAYSDVKFFEGKTGWSIGYRATKAQRNMRTGSRSIKELDWFEYSPVMVGAASQPMTLSIKSLAAPVDPDDDTGLAVDALVDALDEDELARYDELKSAFGLETKDGVRHVRTAAGAARYGQPIGTAIRRDSVSAGSVSVGDSVEFTEGGDKVAGPVQETDTEGDRVKIKVGGSTYDLPSARSIIKAVKVNAENRGDKKVAGNASAADQKQRGKDQQAAFRKLAEGGVVSGEARRNLLRMADRDDYDPTDKAQTQGAATALRMAAAQLDGDEKARVEAMAMVVQRGGDPKAGTDGSVAKMPAGPRDPSAPVAKKPAAGPATPVASSWPSEDDMKRVKKAASTAGLTPGEKNTLTNLADEMDSNEHTTAELDTKLKGWRGKAADGSPLAAALDAAMGKKAPAAKPAKGSDGPTDGDRRQAQRIVASMEGGDAGEIADQLAAARAAGKGKVTVKVQGISREVQVSKAPADLAATQGPGTLPPASPGDRKPAGWDKLTDAEKAAYARLVKDGVSPNTAMNRVTAPNPVTFGGRTSTKGLPPFIEKAKLAALNKRRKADGKPPLDALPDGMKSLHLDILEGLDDVFLEAKGSSATLNRSPKTNWVEKAGELPPYVREVARSVEKTGHDLSSAIAIAIGRIKRWAHGGGDVTAATVAKASAAVAQWEALKAKSGSKYDSDLLAEMEWKATALLDAEDDAWALLYESGGLDDVLGHKADDLLDDGGDPGDTDGTEVLDEPIGGSEDWGTDQTSPDDFKSLLGRAAELRASL